MKISVIIPCYNEELSIEKVIKSLPKDIFEIIIVDNNSTDRTVEIADNMGVQVVREKKQGYGAAIKKGINAARGDVLAVIDGDGQYPAEEITPMARLLENSKVDFIVGSRFPLKSASMPIVRLVGNHFFNIAVRSLFGVKLADSQSGMWVFKKNILDRVFLESDGMSLSQEIKIKVALNPSLRFLEYCIDYSERLGISKLSPFQDGFKNLFALFRLKKNLIKLKN